MWKVLIVLWFASAPMGCATTEYGHRAKYAGVRCEDGKRALYAFQKCRPPASTPEDSESEGSGNDDSAGPST